MNNNNNNNNNNNKKVCLFGLSADPPTGYHGHVGIVQEIVNMNLYDEIYILPVYRHMYADKRRRLAPYEHRMNMCRIAFENIQRTTTTSTTNDDQAGAVHNNNNSKNEIQDQQVVVEEEIVNETILTSETDTNKMKKHQSNNTQKMDHNNNKNKIIISDLEYQVWLHAVRNISDETEKANVFVGTAALLDYLINQKEDHHHPIISKTTTATQTNDSSHQQPLPENKMIDSTIVEYTLCLGSDSFLDLLDGKWKESERIKDIIKGNFLVLYRCSGNYSNSDQLLSPISSSNNHSSSNNDASCINSTSNGTHITTNDDSCSYFNTLKDRIKLECPNAIVHVSSMLKDVSSTKARECFSTNDNMMMETLSTIVTNEIIKYIMDNKLYQFDDYERERERDKKNKK